MLSSKMLGSVGFLEQVLCLFEEGSRLLGPRRAAGPMS